MTEKQIQTSIINYLKKEEVYHFRKPQIGGDKVGIPDIIACCEGRFIAIEVKKPTKFRISTPQEQQKHIIVNSGGLHIYAFSYLDVKVVLEDLRRKK